MTNDANQQTEDAVQKAISEIEISESVATGLAEARKLAMAKAAELEQQNKVVAFPSQRAKIIWSSAIAASVTAIAISLSLQQPNIGLPLEADNLSESLPESLATLTDLDETEWQLIQDLEFALWLSQLTEDEIEPQG